MPSDGMTYNDQAPSRLYKQISKNSKTSNQQFLLCIYSNFPYVYIPSCTLHLKFRKYFGSKWSLPKKETLS